MVIPYPYLCANGGDILAAERLQGYQVDEEEEVDRITQVEKILISFGNKWVKAENDWAITRTCKRKKKLLKWVIEKIFYKINGG